MARSNIKGFSVIGTVKTLRRFGKEGAREQLPPALHHYLEDRILTSLWYPEEEWAQLFLVAGKLLQMQLPDPREDVFVFMGHAAAREALSTIYAGFVEKRDPVRTLERCVTLWAIQHDTGKNTLSLPGSGRAVIELKDYGHPIPELCRLMTGYFQEMLTLSGAEEAKCAETSCVLEGAPACIWELAWKEKG